MYRARWRGDGAHYVEREREREGAHTRKKRERARAGARERGETERMPSRFISFVASGDESPTHFRKIASVYVFENSSNLGATT
jgi:hypothetical protein